MERKEFLKASLCLGALCGVRPAIAEATKAGSPAANPPTVPPPPAPPQPSACEGKAEFARRWVKGLMENLDAQLTEPQRVALMEARGRGCARGGPTKMAEAFKGKLDAFIAEMAKHMDPDGVRREGNVVKVTYSACYCPMVAEIREPLSPTYCACSVGWLKEMYETVTGKPATVEVLETVKRGGKVCRFNVTLTA
jgi:hypothetical protein